LYPLSGFFPRLLLLSGLDHTSATIRSLLFEYVPENRGQAAHHRHASDFGSPPASNACVPGSDFPIVSQNVQDQLSQEKSGDLAALFRDRTQTVRLFARVAAAGRDAPVVGQAPWPGKPGNRVDATRKGEAHKRVHTWDGHQQQRQGVVLTALPDSLLQISDLLIVQIPARQQVIHHHTV
jgi:hypothetical protein